MSRASTKRTTRRISTLPIRAVACAAMLAALSLGAAPLALAQGIVVKAPTITAARAQSDMENTVDRLIQGMEIPGGKFALAALRRVQAETNGLIHTDVTEVYLITQGTGLLVLGGSLADTRETDLTRVWAGPSTSGTHQAGEEHTVAVGDVIVVPAGTAHRFKELAGKIEYLVFRFEAVE